MHSRAQPKGNSVGYIAATFDDMTLVLDQDEAEAVKDTEDLGSEGFTDASNRLVVVEHDGESVPVFRLSRTFQPEDGASRAFVLIAKAGNERLGLMCDNVRTIRTNQVRLEQLPACMQTAATHAISIAHLQDAIGFHCPADVLMQMTYTQQTDRHGDR